MSTPIRQGRTVLRHCGRGLRFLVGLSIGLSLAVAVAFGALVWRLSQGPIEVAWLAREIEAQVNATSPGRQIEIGTATLAWEGLGATDRPLDIRLSDVRFRDTVSATLVTVPHAAVSLSLRRLILGQIAPRSILVRDARLRLIRNEDGSVALTLGGESGTEASGDAGTAQHFLTELAQPARDGSRMGRFAHLRIERAAMIVVDRRLGVTWRVPQATIDLRRQEGGGVRATADLRVALGGETVGARVTGDWGAGGLSLRTEFSELRPAALAQAAPALAQLAALDAPVSGEVTARFSPDFAPVGAEASLRVGGGAVVLPDARVPIAGAEIAAGWAGDTLTLRDATVRWPDGAGGAGPVIRGQGTVRRGETGFAAQLGVRIDAVRLAELPTVWPEGIGPNPRAWLVENLTGGIARDFHAEMTFSAPPDLSDVALDAVSGALRADDVTVHWLRPVPAVEGMSGEVAFDLSTLSIHARGGGIGGIRAGETDILISGLDLRTQTIAIDAPLSGPLTEVLALLRHPRLKLFEKHPLDLRDPSGRVEAQLSVFFPLFKDIDMDTVSISATAKLSDVGLAGIALGQDLEAGQFDMSVDTEGLKLAGTARVLGATARLTVDEDFRAGPATQVLSRQVLSGTFDQKNLAAAGFDPAPYATGPIALKADVQARRNGQQTVAVKADLARTRLAIDDLAWEKPAGAAAHAEATITLQNNRFRSIDRIRLDGDGLSLRGGMAATRDGKPDRIELTQVSLGASRGSGEILLPSGSRPLTVSMRGSMLDLSARFARRHAPASPPAQDTTTDPFAIDARFDRVTLGPDRTLDAVAVTLRHDGRVLADARMSGRTGQNGAFDLTISMQNRQRMLRATSADAGALLKAFDIIDRMQGGSLTVTGTYDDTKPDAPLSGTAEITDFVIRDAPAMAKLLQAMTLYGLVEVVRGPGLGFSRLIAPFSLTEDTLALGESRAFNASLGLTATGNIDLARQRFDLTGTIVPAYVFNSLLGNIPILGRLFSPEQGGGLFAARYTVRGPMDDPDVSVNPLSALTPGFLRNLFGIFEQGGSGGPSAPLPPTAQDGGGN